MSRRTRQQIIAQAAAITGCAWVLPHLAEFQSAPAEAAPESPYGPLYTTAQLDQIKASLGESPLEKLPIRWADGTHWRDV